MKNFILFFSIAIFLSGCKGDNPRVAQELSISSIYGTWQFIEKKKHDVGQPLGYFPVKNGCIYTFNKDGSVIVENVNSPCKGKFYLYKSTSRNFNTSPDSLVIRDFPCVSEICYRSLSLNDWGYCHVFFQDSITMITFQRGCREGCGHKWKNKEDS